MPHQSPNPFDRIRWTLVIPPRIWIGCRTRQLQPERSLETRVLDSTFPRRAGSTQWSRSMLLPDFGKQAVSIHRRHRDQWCASCSIGHGNNVARSSPSRFHATCVEISSTISNVLRRQMASEGCSAVGLWRRRRREKMSPLRMH